VQLTEKALQDPMHQCAAFEWIEREVGNHARRRGNSRASLMRRH